VLYSLEWELIYGFLVNPNPFPLVKIDASSFHFFAPASNSPPFHALRNAKKIFLLATTL
jgi:hypothetical protein